VVAASNFSVHSVCFRLHFVTEKKRIRTSSSLFAVSFLPKEQLLHILSGGVRDHVLHLRWRYLTNFFFARLLEVSFVCRQTIY
jgi:hypothetical protein